MVSDSYRLKLHDDHSTRVTGVLQGAHDDPHHFPPRSGPRFRPGPALRCGRPFFWSPAALLPWLSSRLPIPPPRLFPATVLPHFPLAGGKSVPMICSSSAGSISVVARGSSCEVFVSSSCMAFTMGWTRLLRPVPTRHGPSRPWSPFVASAVACGTLGSAIRLLSRSVIVSGGPSGTVFGPRHTSPSAPRCRESTNTRLCFVRCPACFAVWTCHILPSWLGGGSRPPPPRLFPSASSRPPSSKQPLLRSLEADRCPFPWSSTLVGCYPKLVVPQHLLSFASTKLLFSSSTTSVLSTYLLYSIA